jgi:predicted choloylglycine hydrolase
VHFVSSTHNVRRCYFNFIVTGYLFFLSSYCGRSVLIGRVHLVLIFAVQKQLLIRQNFLQFRYSNLINYVIMTFLIFK